MSTILIAGGTGLIGSALTKMLIEEGHKVIILTRTVKVSEDVNVAYAVWDVKEQKIDEKAVSASDFVINLAGAGIADKRWTKERKKEISESRRQSCGLIVKALQEVPNKVKAVISASAIGWYGKDEKRPPKKKTFTEDMRADREFLGETCSRWEASIEPVKHLGKRLVILRIGVVLSNEGGALPEFIKPIRFGIAGVLGSGQQILSWIHIEDLCRMFLYAIKDETLNGVYNAVSPMPVKNKELTLLLAQKMKGRFFVHLHVPPFIIKAILGELSVEVLKSTTVSAEKIKAAGFTYLFPSVESALNNLIK